MRNGFWPATALGVLAAMSGQAAYAQSTASQMEDEIVVTARRDVGDGAMIAEQAPKARSTITQEFIERQSPGQSILQNINLVPGVSFTNNDPYGSSGGNLRLRGFEGARVSLTFDGVPLNDSGNYAIFSNQMPDGEVIARTNVNLGTTDVDSPTASATGGTVNVVTRTPNENFGLQVDYAGGSFDRKRGSIMVDTGTFTPFGTRAFFQYSNQSYEQFIGPGDLEKTQFNGRIYQPIGDNGDFVSIAAHWNSNRNDFYRTVTLAEFNSGTLPVNTSTCIRDFATPGVADNDASGAVTDLSAPKSCDNFYGLRINPSDTGNIRIQSSFSLGDSLTLTFDPSFQYVMANGGGSSTISEKDGRLAGLASASSSIVACGAIDDGGGTAGVDLNGDCDTRDTVRLYSPSNTNTRRWGLNSSLIWNILEDHRLRFGYTFDEARHRQTGEYSVLTSFGEPIDVFSGKDGHEPPILTADGNIFQKRNRSSVARLNQVSMEYRGDFTDMFTMTAGLRAPFFERELHNFCYAPKATGTSAFNDPTCTSDPADVPTAPLNGFVAPLRATVKFDDLLPNIGFTFRPVDSSQIFLSYAEGLSAPRTDDYYSGLSAAQMDAIEPETTKTYNLGYRYQTERVLFSANVWQTKFANRIERTQQDDGLGNVSNITANIGNVDMKGYDFELQLTPVDPLSLYLTYSHVDTEILGDIVTGGTVANPIYAGIRGRELTETPEDTIGGRVQYDIGDWSLGVQAKYTGERWSNLANTQKTDAYSVWDIDVRWDISDILPFAENAHVQLNGYNIFDEEYLASIGTTGPTGSPTYNLGSPQTWTLSLRTEF